MTSRETPANGRQPRARVGLALGSGGLRGLAHVGVIRSLDKAGISIDCVAGCSIGSLIGALYCSGLDAGTILKLAVSLQRRHWLDFVIPRMGVVAGDRLLDMMRLLTKGMAFQDLPVPLAIVATDLRKGTEVVLREGEVARAVRASVSVPGIFVPFAEGDTLLVDGAVVNPTPVDIARSMGADVVVAVDLAHHGTVSSVTNMFDVIVQSIDIMEKEISRRKHHHGDVIIRPAVGHISPSSFLSMEECARLGEEAMDAALPLLRKKISSVARANKQAK